MRPVVSPVTEELYAALGPWSAADGEETGWALLHMCESVCGVMQPTIDIIRDQDNGTYGWSVVMDPNVAPLDYLPWLGQFVGVKVDTYQPEAVQRAAISGEQGFQRGTVAYFKQQIQKYLQGTKRIILAERDTSPYHFTVTVYQGELAGSHYDSLDATYQTYNAMDAAYVTYGDMSNTSGDQLTAAAKAAKPAGLIMTLTIAPGLP